MFSSAVLVEFQTPAELDAAVARGVVTLRLTDRIGMTADGGEPSLSHLRLIGNRDYESRPQRCLDGRGRRRDADRGYAASRFAARSGNRPLRGAAPDRAERRAAVPADARFAAPRHEMAAPLADIDVWFTERTGAPLSPAGRLLLLGAAAAAAGRAVARREAADGGDRRRRGAVARDARLVAERLGPLAVVVDEENFAGVPGVWRAGDWAVEALVPS